MTTTVLEVEPSTQFITTSIADLGGQLAWLSAVDTPALVGGGSVSDGADGSYVEIGAWYDASINSSHVEIVGCDFHLPTGFTPTAMGMQFRASTPSATLASPPEGGRYWWNVYSNVSDNSALTSMSYDRAAFGPIAQNTLADPTTAETFWGDPLDRANPTDPGNWCEVRPASEGGGEMAGAYEALTGAGLRVYMLIEHYSDGTIPTTGRIPWVNVHEVRLVVAGTSGGVVAPAPPLRQWPRSHRGAASAKRLWPPDRSIQDSLRRGGGTYL